MAVTKIWQIKGSLADVVKYAGNPEKTKPNDLARVVGYAADEHKTLDENEQFYGVTGVNCNAKTALAEMLAVQERFGKTGGNVAYHAYQSFKTGEVTPEQCHRLGIELAQKMWGCGSPVETSDCNSNQKHRPSRQARPQYQVLVATHFNTGTLHNHFVLQPVCLWDGKKYDCNKREYYRMRQLSDEMCRREGLTVIKNPGRRAPRQIYFAEKNGEPTKYNLMREAIDEALSCSCNEAEFETALRQLGYRIYLGLNVKYATIRSLGSKRGTRLYRLGEEYDRSAIFKRLNENLQYDRLNTNRRYEARFYKFTYTWVDTHPPPPEYNLRKALYNFNVERASLIEIYAVLFVLILDLTVQTIKSAVELLLPETQVPECVIAACMKPKSPEMREAVRFAERYTRQLMLLSQEKFRSIDEVRNYISDRELKIAEVQAYREHWKNKLRSAKTPEQTAEYTKKRNRCTEMLKNLRFQKRVAGTLVTDETKIKQLLKSEQNIQRGNDPYEWANGYRIRDAKTDKTLSR